MAKTRDLPLADYPTGTRTFVKQTPNGLNGFLIAIARCTTADTSIWPNVATELDLIAVPSYDGGATFDRTAAAGMSGATGGIRVNSRTGLEYTVQDCGVNFTPPANAVEITVTIRNGPLRTFADVTVL